MNSWKKIPKHLQLMLEAAVAMHSYMQYSAFQKADLKAFDDFQKKQGSL